MSVISSLHPVMRRAVAEKLTTRFRLRRRERVGGSVPEDVAEIGGRQVETIRI
jgi:hypothetical protein